MNEPYDRFRMEMPNNVRHMRTLDGNDGSVGDIIARGDVDHFSDAHNCCACRSCDWNGDVIDAQRAAEADEEPEENEKGIDPNDRDEGGVV